MSHPAKLLVAVPCYNEAENIPLLAQAFFEAARLVGPGLGWEVHWIDDASTDATGEAIRALGEGGGAVRFTSERHPANRGLTGGLRTAFRHFAKRCAEDSSIVACGLLDGDNSHHPGHFPGMLEVLGRGFDVVIASRYQPGSRTLGVVWWRQVLSGGMSMLFRLARPLPGARDYSCGFRLYRPALCLRLWKTHGERIVTEESFACMVELLVRCHEAGAVIAEFPMLLRYDLKGGASKMRFFQTIAGTLRVLSRK